MEELFKNLEQVRSEIDFPCQAVVVSLEKGCFIYGNVVDLRRDIFPNSSYWKHRLELWKAGAGRLYGEENVFVVEGLKAPKTVNN